MVVFEKNGVFEFRARQMSDMIADFSPEFREFIASLCRVSTRLAAFDGFIFLIPPATLRKKLEKEIGRESLPAREMLEVANFLVVLRDMETRGVWVDCNEW